MSAPPANRLGVRSLLTLLAVSLSALTIPSSASASPPLRSLTANPHDLPDFTRARVHVHSIPLGHGFARMLIRNPRVGPLEPADHGFLEGVEDSLYTPLARVFSAAVVFRSPAAARNRMATWALEAEFILNTATPRGPVPKIPGSWTMSISGDFSTGVPPQRWIFFQVADCIALYSLQVTNLQDFEATLHIAFSADAGATALYHRAQAVCS